MEMRRWARSASQALGRRGRRAARPPRPLGGVDPYGDRAESLEPLEQTRPVARQVVVRLGPRHGLERAPTAHRDGHARPARGDVDSDDHRAWVHGRSLADPGRAAEACGGGRGGRAAALRERRCSRRGRPSAATCGNSPRATKPITLRPLGSSSEAGIVTERISLHFLTGPAASGPTSCQFTRSAPRRPARRRDGSAAPCRPSAWRSRRRPPWGACGRRRSIPAAQRTAARGAEPGSGEG